MLNFQGKELKEENFAFWAMSVWFSLICLLRLRILSLFFNLLSENSVKLYKKEERTTEREQIISLVNKAALKWQFIELPLIGKKSAKIIVPLNKMKDD